MHRIAWLWLAALFGCGDPISVELVEEGSFDSPFATVNVQIAPDFDGDGANELFLMTREAMVNHWYLISRAGDRMLEFDSWPEACLGDIGPDADGDGLPDAALASTSDQQFGVVGGSGEVVWALRSEEECAGLYGLDLGADINGDGLADLAMVVKCTPAMVELRAGNTGALLATQPLGHGRDGSRLRQPVSFTTDRNGDGIPDVLVSRRDGYTIFSGRDLTPLFEVEVADRTYCPADQAGLDLDGDGDATDAVCHRVFDRAQSSVFVAGRLIPLEAVGVPIHVWDMNRDGLGEIAVLDYETNQLRIFDVWGTNLFRMPWGEATQGYEPSGVLGSEGAFELVAPTVDEIRFFGQP